MGLIKLGYDSFKMQLDKAADFFSSFDKNKQVKVISHYDADGICSAALIIELLNLKGMGYCINVVSQLDDDILKNISMEEYQQYIFTDLGSVFVDKISRVIKNGKVLILDHHRTGAVVETPNICHVNPHLHNIDGSKEVSGSGVCYLFAERVCNIKNLSHLPIVGAIGDSQANHGLRGLNKQLLHLAEKEGMIQVQNGLRLFGAHSRPLPKLLRNSYDPFIPGITGNFKGALEFLRKLGINHKDGRKNRMLYDLSESELKNLGDAIIEKCPNMNKKKLFGKIYTVCNETGSFRDGREYATVLNGCGRLDKSTVGIAACLGDDKMKIKALEMQEEYRRELQAILSWFKSNKNSGDVHISPKYIIVNCKRNVPSSMAGTFASIIAYSEEVENGAFVLTLSRLENNSTKVSVRLKGRSDKVDLNSIISKIVRIVGGQSGGHSNAAGAIIDTCKEIDFINQAKRTFEEFSLIEDVTRG